MISSFTPIDSAIGTAKTVLVLNIASKKEAVVSSVHVRLIAKELVSRIRYTGSVELNDDAKLNIRTVVLPIIDQILNSLQFEKKDYEISFCNIGISSAIDTGLEISGFSAELPVLVAMLSASLELPLSQNAVSTGHIASSNGDIGAVIGLPEKVKAAVKEKSSKIFIYPDPARDRSIAEFTPDEFNRIKHELDALRDSIELLAVSDIAQVIKHLTIEEDIVQASLKTGFYGIKKSTLKSNNPVNKIAAILTENNEKRFWNILEFYFLAGEIKRARGLLECFVSHHNQKRVYPDSFGIRLMQLMLSIPVTIKRRYKLFPLLPVKHIIDLVQSASKTDYEDVKDLFNAVSGDFPATIRAKKDSKKLKSTSNDQQPDMLLEYFLESLTAENITSKISFPIDSARAAYSMDKITIEGYEEFYEAIVSFYSHLLRHLDQIKGVISNHDLAPEATALLERTFARDGGEKAAYSEALNCTKGGLKFILDKMTEQYKAEEKHKYIRSAFKGILDPFDFKKKTSLMKAFLNKFGANLPEDIRNQPPEKYQESYEEIITSYAESLEQVVRKLRTL